MNQHPLNNRRISSPALPEVVSSEDSLVTDARAGLTPAQMVDRKLVSLLRNTPVPVSQLHTRIQPRRLS